MATKTGKMTARQVRKEWLRLYQEIREKRAELEELQRRIGALQHKCPGHVYLHGSFTCDICGFDNDPM